MGRFETNKKPSASASDPAQSAKSASIKQELASHQARSSNLTVPATDPSQVKAFVNRLSKHDLLLAVNELIDNNVDARVALKNFCERPQGSSERPYDFGPVFARCKEGLDVFDDSDWEYARSHHDHWQLRSDIADGAVASAQTAIDTVRNVCIKSTSSQQTKMKGMEVLLDIGNLVKGTPEMDTEQDVPENQPDLMRSAVDAVKAILQTSGADDRARFHGTSYGQGLMERADELERLAKELKNYYTDGEDDEANSRT